MSRRVHRSALVAAPAELMFDLIDRVEDYPQFLPWCVATQLIERSPELVSATVTVGWKHLRIEVTTRNPKRIPERMEIHLEGGTFRHFMGLWELRPLGERGCRVDFTLEYELALPGADRVAGNLIDHAADRMVDAFVARAESLADMLPARPTEPTPPVPAPTTAAEARPDAADTAQPVAATEARSAAPAAAPADEPLAGVPARPLADGLARPASHADGGSESTRLPPVR